MVATNVWRRLDDEDPVARAFVDRCQIESGRRIVLITGDEAAVWLSHWPDPMRVLDRMDFWRCSIFRNETPELGCELIRSAMQLTSQIWRPLRPRDGWVTWVDRREDQSPNPEHCFIEAGWWRDTNFVVPPHIVRLRAAVPPFSTPRRQRRTGSRVA